MADINETVPDGSEQLDQLDPDTSLIHRGVADPLDEGFIPPDDWSPAQKFGTTPREMREGETLDQRVRQEEPETKPHIKGDRDVEGERLGAVGDRRAGRLVDANHGIPGEDTESEMIASEVGIAGAAASAEEAAVHVVDENHDVDDDSDDDL